MVKWSRVMIGPTTLILIIAWLHGFYGQLRATSESDHAISSDYSKTMLLQGSNSSWIYHTRLLHTWQNSLKFVLKHCKNKPIMYAKHVKATRWWHCVHSKVSGSSESITRGTKEAPLARLYKERDMANWKLISGRAFTHSWKTSADLLCNLHYSWFYTSSGGSHCWVWPKRSRWLAGWMCTLSCCILDLTLSSMLLMIWL